MDAESRRRSPRRDALANRERLIAEAEQHFNEHGLDASLHSLVDRMGVGIGTLYRHFPTRDDLIRAVYDRQVERMSAVFDGVRGIDDGWEAIVACIDGAVELQLRSPSMRPIAARMASIAPDYRPAYRWHQTALEMLARAQAQGSVRRDVTAMDVAFLPTMFEALAIVPEPSRGVVLARLRAIMLDGLRPAAMREALPEKPLAPSMLDDIAHRRWEVET